MAVITRTDDDRPLVAEFAGAVRSCRRSRSTLVRGATMLEPAGAAHATTRRAVGYIRSGASTPSRPRPARMVCATATQQSRRKAATGASWPMTGQRS